MVKHICTAMRRCWTQPTAEESHFLIFVKEIEKQPVVATSMCMDQNTQEALPHCPLCWFPTPHSAYDRTLSNFWAHRAKRISFTSLIFVYSSYLHVLQVTRIHKYQRNKEMSNSRTPRSCGFMLTSVIVRRKVYCRWVKLDTTEHWMFSVAQSSGEGCIDGKAGAVVFAALVVTGIRCSATHNTHTMVVMKGVFSQGQSRMRCEIWRMRR